MNLQSEISFFSEMATADKARLMASFLAELTSEARATYGATQESVHDGAHLRLTNELCHRVAKISTGQSDGTVVGIARPCDTSSNQMNSLISFYHTSARWLRYFIDKLPPRQGRGRPHKRI